MNDGRDSSWQRVKEVFHGAADLAPDQREDFLDHACAGEPHLRREVEALLARDRRGDPRLERPVYEAAAELLARDPWEDVQGRRLGAYRILRELGRGGMGRVLLAERADGQYRQQVAIKEVLEGLQDPLRFQQERQILASLEHPHIARLLDGGVTGDGQPYLVMEYIQGEPVDGYCRRHRLPLGRRLDLFRQVCAAVHHAHRHLVVHCDLKPSNILVTADGEAKLLDFGVARLLGSQHVPPVAAGESPRQLRLTPAFASPEQVRGLPLTTASDVYSLGVLLYVLLADRLPYEVRDLPPGEVEQEICHRRPPPPSRSLGEGAVVPPRRLKGDLDAIVLAALRKEPEERYGSAEQLAEDLRRHRKGLPVKARPNTLAYRATAFGRRHWIGVLAATLVASSLIAGIAAATWQARRAEAARHRAEQQQQRAEEVTAFLENLFRSADPGQTRNADLTLRAFLDDAAGQIPSELASQPETLGRLLNILGEGYRGLGMYEEGRKILQRALEVRRRAFGEEHEAVAESLNSLGLVLLEQGALDDAEGAVGRALEIQIRRFGEEHEAVAESLNSLGRIRRRQGQAAAAVSLFNRSLTLRRRLLGEPQRELSISLNNLGLLLHEMGQREEARPLLEEALQQRLELFGERHVLVANSRQNLALLLADLGHLEAAREQGRRALEVYRQLLGENHPRVAAGLHNLADLRYRAGDGEGAKTLLEESMAINEARRDDVALAANLMQLGRLLYQEGSYRRAEAALLRSFEIRREHPGAGHLDFSDALYSLAVVLRAGGAMARAREPLRSALEAWEGTPPPRDWDVPYTQSLLGEALLAADRREEARDWLRRGRAGLLAAGREDLALGLAEARDRPAEPPAR